MAKILDIKCRQDGPRYKVFFYLNDRRSAKDYAATYLGCVRNDDFLAELYPIGNILCLDTPDEKSSFNIAIKLKNAILYGKPL